MFARTALALTAVCSLAQITTSGASSGNTEEVPTCVEVGSDNVLTMICPADIATIDSTKKGAEQAKFTQIPFCKPSKEGEDKAENDHIPACTSTQEVANASNQKLSKCAKAGDVLQCAK